MSTFKFKSLLPLLTLLLAPLAAQASLSIGVSINIAPPELPVYEQPPIPEPGYMWTPGYWAWGPDGYYWVPGTWVLPPRVGFLWTPGYWGWRGGLYIWNLGYWGPHVGFYGGVNYGYGYGGYGYEGGYWRGDRLYYNRNVNNITNVHITNVYNRTVINNVTVNRVSYNGGNGVRREPTREELSSSRDPHIGYTNDQRNHEQGAARDRSFLATVNHGRPAVAVMQRPAAFDRPGSAGPSRGPSGSGSSDRMQRTDRPPAANGQRPYSVSRPLAQTQAPLPSREQTSRDRPPNRGDRSSRDRPGGNSPQTNYPVPVRAPASSHDIQRQPGPAVRVPERSAPARVEQPPAAQPQERRGQENRRGPEGRDQR